MRKSIVCVDDDRTILDLFRATLGREHSLDLHSCPEHALKAFHPLRTDLLITDHQLGNHLTGHDLIQRVRGIGYTGPVLLLSSAPPQLDYRRQGLEIPLAYNYPFAQKGGNFPKVRRAIYSLLALQ